jgi:hypothetical protein
MNEANMRVYRIILVVVFLIMPILLPAGTTCETATVVPADGRIVDFDFVANGTTNFYQFSVTQGRSYSVEVRENYDDPPSTLTASLFSNSGCSTPLTSVNTNALDPALPANSFRRSFTAATSGVHTISVQNTGSNGRYISVSVSDTTLVSPRWSTHGGFYTAWGFTNTTGHAITGQLTMVDSDTGSPVIPAQTVNVPANTGIFVVTAPKAGGLPVPANRTGAAFFTYNGPPGAIVADGFIVNDRGPVIQPVIFVAPRQSAH